MEEEVSLSKLLYKIELLAIKYIPVVIAFIYFLSSVLSCVNIEAPILSYIGGMSLLTIIFLYLTSYVFRFCEYHRLPLHYIVVSDVINYIDYYIGIPLGYRGMLVLQVLLAGATILGILYLKYKVCKKS